MSFLQGRKLLEVKLPGRQIQTWSLLCTILLLKWCHWDQACKRGGCLTKQEEKWDCDAGPEVSSDDSGEHWSQNGTSAQSGVGHRWPGLYTTHQVAIGCGPLDDAQKDMTLVQAALWGRESAWWGWQLMSADSIPSSWDKKCFIKGGYRQILRCPPLKL